MVHLFSLIIGFFFFVYFFFISSSHHRLLVNMHVYTSKQHPILLEQVPVSEYQHLLVRFYLFKRNS